MNDYVKIVGGNRFTITKNNYKNIEKD